MIDFFKMVKDEKLAEIFKVLRQSDFDINQQDEHGKTALHFALNLQIIKILIASGSDVNISDRKGKTPLDYAPNDKVRQILLEHGAKHGVPVILKQDLHLRIWKDLLEHAFSQIWIPHLWTYRKHL